MKKKVLVSSILTIALCLSLIAGSTFALFTSESKVNIAVNSAQVKLEASVENIETWSLENDKTAAGRTDGTFTMGGSAAFLAGTLTLDKIVPGDKVSFDITGVNSSNVITKYRVKIDCTEGELLMSGLEVTIGDDDPVTGFVSYASAWTTLPVGSDIDPVKVSIELPEEAGNDFQNKTAKITVLVEAIQGNAETLNEVNASKAVGTKVDGATGKTMLEEKTSVSANGFGATIPEDTILNSGATTATLNVTEEEANIGNFNFDGAETFGLNISIPEVAADNDKAIIVTLKGILSASLNDVQLFHKGVPMTPVASADDVDADGEFFYNATTGDVTLATVNFSNFSGIALNSVDVATEAELTAAIKDGNNVTLTADITLTKTLEIDNNVVIDLNGYDLNANLSANTMIQSKQGNKPDVLIFSSKEGAKINAGDKGVLLGYGRTSFYNVEINVGTIKSSSLQTFNVRADLTLGEGTVVNVEFLGTSLISNHAKAAIVIDGAEFNVKNFKVNSGAMISLQGGTTLAINNTEINVGLDTTYTSYFVSRAEHTTIEGLDLNVTDATGASYDIVYKPDAAVGAKYAWVQK